MIVGAMVGGPFNGWPRPFEANETVVLICTAHGTLGNVYRLRLFLLAQHISIPYSTFILCLYSLKHCNRGLY